MSKLPLSIRLELASLKHRDAFVAAARRSRKLHRSWVTPPTTNAKFKTYLKAKLTTSCIAYLVFSERDELVGAVMLNEIVRGAFHSAYLGYYAFAPHHGQGYMTAALSAVVSRAFSKHALHRLEANVQPTNAASLALVRKLGFRREGYSPRYLKIGGRWRDHERWAITREEWNQATHSSEDSRARDLHV